MYKRQLQGELEQTIDSIQNVSSSQVNIALPANQDFALANNSPTGASVLVTRANFGCGSSREHAPWAIAEFGVRTIIAPSFADIFYNNCFKNGIVPVVLDERVVDSLFQAVALQPGYRLTVDLVEQRVQADDGSAWHFDVDAFRRECLLNGWDDIGLTLRHADEIREFEALRLRRFPWLGRDLPN